MHTYLAHAFFLPTIHHACMHPSCSSQPLHLSVCTLLHTIKPSHATHFCSLSDKVAGLTQSPCPCLVAALLALQQRIAAAAAGKRA